MKKQHGGTGTGGHVMFADRDTTTISLLAAFLSGDDLAADALADLLAESDLTEAADLIRREGANLQDVLAYWKRLRAKHEAQRQKVKSDPAWYALPPTPKQAGILRQRGKWLDGMTRGQANDLITQIAKDEGWDQPKTKSRPAVRKLANQ